IPCESPYNCILGRPTLATLGVVPSAVHLKTKYHDEKGGVITIEANMTGAKKCHQSMHKTAKKTAKWQQSNTTPMETLPAEENQKPKHH
ncbi:hypothetical protein A2U01_0068144, partial [Trifolium medium]|nr:hypothetical protein [Trifolium medium]